MLLPAFYIVYTVCLFTYTRTNAERFRTHTQIPIFNEMHERKYEQHLNLFEFPRFLFEYFGVGAMIV